MYWNYHVDKANIASYDYSALLYLTTWGAPAESAAGGDLESRERGGDFEGGELAFADVDADRVVRPLAGRLVAFTSGLENLHAVRRVTRGVRLVLAMWFTCSPAHATDPPMLE